MTGKSLLVRLDEEQLKQVNRMDWRPVRQALIEVPMRVTPSDVRKEREILERAPREANFYWEGPCSRHYQQLRCKGMVVNVIVVNYGYMTPAILDQTIKLGTSAAAN